jgi:hypothetical protein
MNTRIGFYAANIVVVIAAFYNASCREIDEKVPEVQTLISHVVEAYGGKDTIERIKSVYAEGEIEAFMRRDAGTYIRYLERSRKLRVDIRYGRSSEHRILQGEKGWRVSGEGSPIAVSGHRYLSMVYQYKELTLPYGLLLGLYRVEDEGEAELNSASVRVLRLSDSEGPPMKIYVDVNRFYIVKVTGSFTVNGIETDLSAEFSDFRKIQGMPFPFKITNFGGGQKIGETLMRKYIVNPDIGPSVFQP